MRGPSPHTTRDSRDWAEATPVADELSKSVIRKDTIEDRCGLAGRGIVTSWLVDRPSPELERQIRSLSVSPDVTRIAIMPDVHVGPHVPNGVAVATRQLLYPRMVGSDIGCGVSSLKFDLQADHLLARSGGERLLRHLYSCVPQLKQPKQILDCLPPISEHLLSDPILCRSAQRDGRYQLGTLGRGNHFVEIQKGRDGAVWVMVHSGSRIMGQEITNFHLKRAVIAENGMQHLRSDSARGQAYLSDMQWAMSYATLSRMVILNRVADLLEQCFDARPLGDSYVDSPHNFVRKEDHFGESLLVHRKSVLSARQGEMGVIPGSMADVSHLVRGRGAVASLCSASHGAGRLMSRSEAATSLSTKELIQAARGVIFDGTVARDLLDEAPQAYRRMHTVMAAQRELVATVETFAPLVSFKLP